MDPTKKSHLKGTIVRVEMAKEHGQWRKFVSNLVGEYMDARKMVETFRTLFGAETLKSAGANYFFADDCSTEKDKIKKR